MALFIIGLLAVLFLKPIFKPLAWLLLITFGLSVPARMWVQQFGSAPPGILMPAGILLLAILVFIFVLVRRIFSGRRRSQNAVDAHNRAVIYGPEFEPSKLKQREKRHPRCTCE
jgi:hypothetical protein